MKFVRIALSAMYISIVATCSWAQEHRVIGDIGSTFLRYTVDQPKLELNEIVGTDNYWDLSGVEFNGSSIFSIKQPEYGSAIPLVGEADVLIENEDFEYYYDAQDGNLLLKGSSKIEITPGHHHTGVSDTYYDIHREVFEKEEFKSECSMSSELFEDDLQEIGLIDVNPYDYRYMLTRIIYQNMRLSNRGTLILPNGRFSVEQIVIVRDIEQFMTVRENPFSEDETILSSDYSLQYKEKEIRFYTHNLLFPICKIFLNNDLDEISRIEVFDYTDRNKDGDNFTSKKDQFIIQNNPTFGKVILAIQVTTPGVYHLEVKNILGSTVHHEKIRIQNRLKLPADFTFLKKGSYFCSLVNEAGSTVMSKKLVILKP